MKQNELDLVPLATHLSTINGQLLINDLGHDFLYKRVVDPNNNDTDKHLLYFKNKESIKWHLANGLLSDFFSVIKLEDIVKKIKEDLKGDIISQIHYRSKTMIKYMFILKNYNTSNRLSEEDKVVFQLLTSMNIDQMISDTCLAFSIINGYSGNHRLDFNYGFLTNIKDTKNKKINIPVNNFFLLDEFSSSLIHNRQLNLKYNELNDVKNEIDNKIEHFKNCEITDKFLEEFEEKFSKKINKYFIGIYNNLLDNMKNLYYVSLILSYYCLQDKNISREIEFRKFLLEYA